MPHASRKETEYRLRRMAVATVDMEQGLYTWPNGLAPTLPDGRARYSKQELLRAAGYSTNYKSSGKQLFEDDYYLRHVQLERVRRETRLPAVQAKSRVNLMALAEALHSETLARLLADPESATMEQLLKYGPDIYERAVRESAAGLEGNAPARDARLQQFNTFIGKFVNSLDDQGRESLATTTAEGANVRGQTIQSALFREQAREEICDDDVIDAEISSESP